MKAFHPTLFLACMLCFTAAIAQDCATYLPFQKGNKIEYAMTDKKEKPSGKLQYLINDVSTVGGALTANITSTMSDEKGKQISTSNFTYACNGGDLIIDMKSMVSDQLMSSYKDMTVKAEGGMMTIPFNASVGSTLPDGTMHMDILNEGKNFATMDVKITNQKVEAKEDITTPAGTFSCIRISYDSEIRTVTMGIGIPIITKAVTWYSQKAGVVKSDSYGKDDKLLGRMVLSSVTK